MKPITTKNLKERRLLSMKSDVQEILNYYLEYEIYNISNSSQIKLENNKQKNFLIIKDTNFNKHLDYLKINKIRKVSEVFIGKTENKLIELIIDNSIEDKFNQQTIKKLILDNTKKKFNNKIIDNFIEELYDIKVSNCFWLYADNISIEEKDKIKKQPIFILKCELENEKVTITEINVNVETINKILSILLNEEISSISLEYGEKIPKYLKEINLCLDSGNIEHIIDLFYIKLKEYIDPILSRENIKNISQKNNRYKLNEEYIISLDEIVDDTIKNIKEDIETLKKIINYDSYIPNLLNKYLNGTKDKNNINDERYKKIYKGNYKSDYGVGQNQYKIVNSIIDNDLIAIEGPPGTGKTSLLKEIIANKIVERTNLILKNWEQEFSYCTYFTNSYYQIDWFLNNKDTIKSIVVSSKNGEAIENVGKEINKEIKYMYPLAKEYRRTIIDQNGRKIKELQNYKGIICLPLGKNDNIQDFKSFLYEQFIPTLKNFQDEEKIKQLITEAKKNYEDKLEEVKEYENLIESLNKVKDKTKYFYGIQVLDENSINKIEDLFFEDKYNKENKLYNIIKNLENIEKNLKNKKEELNSKKTYIDTIKFKIKQCQENKEKRMINIQQLQDSKGYFAKINKNIITRFLNYKIYKKNKNYDFNKEITNLVILNETEDKRITEYIKEENELEKKYYELNKQYLKLNDEYTKYKNEEKEINIDIKEMDLINEFNETNKQNYWHYKNSLDMYCKSHLNVLNQELFQLALDLNEAYILKNREKIINNLELFLPEEDKSHICQKFYDSTDIYNEPKQNAIRSLWNTLFLCFPVVTTTLDSFCKKCFHLIPEYIDLELIDEAGQILPHNLVSALYRANKAVIVGDVNQIEPIYNNINKDFNKNAIQIGDNFKNIKVEENSIQLLANKNTDILSDNDTIILNDHYRCEKNIINFSNENVYNNKLNMHVDNNLNKPFLSNMIALDVRGKKTIGKNENKAEVESCIETIKYIKEFNKKEISIAVITPFREQKHLLEDVLKKENLKDIKVGTVHAFQGQEKDYIIFLPVIDSVEPRWAVNFIGKKFNMLNVAVTRAKKQFIYIGNLKAGLQTNNYIAKLIKYIKDNGQIYSLYNNEEFKYNENFNEKLLQILQPKLILDNDIIGLYIKKNFEDGIVIDAKKHYELLMYSIKNTKKEIYIMSPWLMDNVINEDFLKEIQRLKENKCIVKIVFGYKKGQTQISNAEELVDELEKTNSLGYATKKSILYIAQKLYKILGKENFIYAPPIHAKIVIVDNKYMFIGSHNWLSNAGKTEERLRAIEGTKITTSKESITYVKENIFNCKK